MLNFNLAHPVQSLSQQAATPATAVLHSLLRHVNKDILFATAIISYCHQISCPEPPGLVGFQRDSKEQKVAVDVRHPLCSLLQHSGGGEGLL